MTRHLALVPPLMDDVIALAVLIYDIKNTDYPKGCRGFECGNQLKPYMVRPDDGKGSSMAQRIGVRAYYCCAICGTWWSTYWSGPRYNEGRETA